MRFPRSNPPEAVLLNTSGGLTDGDELNNSVHWRAGTQATVTTQAAERIYRAATRDFARVTTQISIDDDCIACWLPQEMIVFDGARLRRSLEIDMTSNSRLLAIESTVFGRRAMGETVTSAHVSDRWRIRIDGRLAFVDHFLIDDELTTRVDEYLGRTAAANSAHCLATMVIVVDDCEQVVANARELDAPTDTLIGATSLGQLAVIRILAGDSQAMRTAVVRVIDSLNGILDIELPRVWQC